MRSNDLFMDNEAYILTHFQKNYINVYRKIAVGHNPVAAQ